MSAIRVVKGTYRNRPVRNQEFVLVNGFQTGARGNYVTVKNNGTFPNCPDTVRISVDNIRDIEYTNGMTQPNTVHFENFVQKLSKVVPLQLACSKPCTNTQMRIVSLCLTTVTAFC